MKTPQKPKRHVVIASPGGHDGAGGMGTVSRLIVERLPGSGSAYEGVVIDPRGGGPAIWWPFYFMAAALNLARRIRGGDAAIVHLQVSERSSFIRKGLLGAIAKICGIPVVLHHHGPELISTFRSGPRLLRWMMARTAQAADINLVLGESVKRFVVDELRVPESRVHVLRNGTADASQAAAGVVRRPRELVMIANMTPRKGVGDLLKALSLLKGRGFPVQAVLAGGGEVDRYRAEAKDLGVLDMCTFMGWVAPEKMPALLASAAALVLPSFHEGMPMVILEALSAGVPVVTTPVGIIPEVLTDRTDCLFVTPGDSDALADAVELMMTDEALRTTLSLNGRRLYETEFTPEKYIEKLVAFYDGLPQMRR